MIRALLACVLLIFPATLARAQNAVPSGNIWQQIDSTSVLQRQIDGALAKQKEMLAAHIRKIVAGRRGVRDVYFVGVAGWGDQDVFQKETRAVQALFDKSFGTAGRSLVLVNNPATLGTLPLATRQNIEAALLAVGQKMNTEEDVLVLFLTSHGAEWNGIGLMLQGRETDVLTPAQLARMLGASRIRNRIVVVSACYSGQFGFALADEHTLLMTAAAADRTSFGCTTEAEWTYFGQAFFRDALPRLRKFAPAFEEAAATIARREASEGLKPSAPQIRVGPRIVPVLNEIGF